MRVIGGKFRSVRIKVSSPHVRPAKDSVREAVFNMISLHIQGASVLDVFSGSGAYGLEALSRGAVSCIFVEKDAVCVQDIKENVARLGVSGISEVKRCDAVRYSGIAERNAGIFDIVFADPPYDQGKAKNILNTYSHCDIFSDSGLLIIEHSVKENLPDKSGCFSVYKQKSYGKTAITVYKKYDKNSDISRDL